MKLNNLAIGIITCLALTACAISPSSEGVKNNNGGPTDTGPVIPDLTGVFASPIGNDTNSGTNRSVPLFSIARAVSNAAANGLTNIYVSQGTYRPGSGLASSLNGLVISNSGLNFSAGWDTNFISASGYTVLDGTNGLEHVVAMVGVSNTIFQGFFIMNGYASGTSSSVSNGGGMYLTNIFSCIVTNTVISNNYAFRNGGGLWVRGVSNLLSVMVQYNQCDSGTYYGNGGGIFVEAGSYFNNFYVEVNNNSATYGGGIFFNTNSGNNGVYGNVAYNTANTPYQYGGGGIAFFSSSSNQIHAVLNANSAQNGNCYGGGVFVIGNYNSIYGTISSNSSFEGGGITLYSGSGNNVSATVKDNSAGNLGGGIYIQTAAVTISGLILRNYSYYAGGGIFNYSGSVTLTNSIVANNVNSLVYGGGLCDQNTVSTTNGSSIYNNTPNDYYKF